MGAEFEKRLTSVNQPMQQQKALPGKEPNLSGPSTPAQQTQTAPQPVPAITQPAPAVPQPIGLTAQLAKPNTRLLSGK